MFHYGLFLIVCGHVCVCGTLCVCVCVCYVCVVQCVILYLTMGVTIHRLCPTDIMRGRSLTCSVSYFIASNLSVCVYVFVCVFACLHVCVCVCVCSLGVRVNSA